MEVETSNKYSSFLACLGHKKDLKFIYKSVQETYTYRTIFTFQIGPPQHVKRGVVYSLVNKAKSFVTNRKISVEKLRI
jgi:hypothetical protein